MTKMAVTYVVVVLLFSLSVLGLTNTGQESVTLISLHEYPTSTSTSVQIAVSASNGDLRDISSSVLMAESWLRTHVLSRFPATHITAIVVGTNVLCRKDHEDLWGFVLPSLTNIHYALVRWGSEKEIKLSAAFSQDCLHYYPLLAESLIKPLLSFLLSSNSTYSINPPPGFSSYETMKLASLHLESIKKLGFSKLNHINVIITTPKRPISRRPSFKIVDPFPARPTPLPPLRSSIGFSVPAHVAKNPHPPPLPQPASSPSISAPDEPPLQLPPLVMPSNPPDVPVQAPCSAGPVAGGEEELWCVAKPSVPLETLQEAMDYACGEGGGDCEEINEPNGSCFYPDNVFAHTSYAFNSYWQKNKNSGGSCSFGGAAMVINADPSYQQCRFTVV